jgi:hypothetical protein
MPDINGGDTCFFSEETYQAFVKRKNWPLTERSRDECETIFDIAVSEEADFTKHPKGEEILKAIRECE